MRSSLRMYKPQKNATAVGMAMNMNKACQGRNWRVTPETIVPDAPPMATAVVWDPRAFPRSFPGNTEVVMAVETACPMELPRDMMTRVTIKNVRLVANAHAMAPPPKRMRPIRWNFLRPIMSATLPKGTMNAETVRDWAMTRRDASLNVMPKSSAIAGRARKTMLKLITMVTSESPTAQNARHLYQAFSGAAGSHAGVAAAGGWMD